MTVLIFGRGFIGCRLARELPSAVLSPADICDERAVARAIEEHRPAAVVNAAGKTGRPNVDWCETHQVETYRANVIGPLALAAVCRSAGVYLLHLSSGCVFYGPSPSPGGWREDDFANPLSFYSRTKYASDLVLSRMDRVGIARLRMPIDSTPSDRNLITKLAAYKQVIDVENSVTFVEDLVRVIAGLIQHRAEGVFHATNSGTMKHRDLLRMYREMVDPNHEVELIDEPELLRRGLAVKARSNCILASPRLRDLGLEMRPAADALRETMAKYAAAAAR